MTTAQLYTLGLKAGAIHSRARRGLLHPIHRGVFAVGHRALTCEGRFLAAVLAVGDGAVLSHYSAAALWGIWRLPTPRQPIDVTVARNRRQRRGLRLHTPRTLAASDATTERGIPVTTPARTLVDLAGAVAGEHALLRTARDAEVNRLITYDRLVQQLARAPRRRGAARLRQILDLGPAPTRSELEDRALGLLHRHGFDRPSVNARVETAAGTFEVDFLFAERNLILETDGLRYHATPQAHRADARKQAALETAGYWVLRLTWEQITRHEQQTVARLKRALDTPR